MCVLHCLKFFFFKDTATTEIYTLSLHDALPIFLRWRGHPRARGRDGQELRAHPQGRRRQDRKSTRLNSSHVEISYAVFCLKKKKNKNNLQPDKNSRKILLNLYPNNQIRSAFLQS